MSTLAPHNLPDHLLSSGVNTFTLAEATQLLERTGDAVRKGLERLTRKRLIFSPARGFYVVVPPQFRRQGTVPATHFIDAMMQALGRRYYVSLVSAAALHGAVKPAPSEPLQVMVDRHVTDRDLGTTELWFYKSRHAAYDIGIEEHDGPTGALRVASRELTAVDLVQHIDDCGGINHVAALLDALIPLRIPTLADLAGTRDLATARRLGHLLSRLDPNLGLGPLQELADLHRPTPTDLVAGARRRGRVDPHWNVRINAQVTATQ
jgi:predicted transcriptional regulator of viral defense system